jgi:hypothetical protein
MPDLRINADLGEFKVGFGTDGLLLNCEEPFKTAPHWEVCGTQPQDNAAFSTKLSEFAGESL